jgi:hypothetical protein
MKRLPAERFDIEGPESAILRAYRANHTSSARMERDGNWLYPMASAKEAMKTAIGTSKSALPVVFR